MSLRKLDHVNVRTRQLGQMKQFYQDVLGMKAGPRPDFPFPGAWMYLGDQPVVHLVGVEEQDEPVSSQQAETTTDTKSATAMSLQLTHFAFSADGPMQSFIETLEMASVSHEIRVPPGGTFSQVHVFDPDGNHIHIDFQHTAQS